jgi:hypothetical protein
MPKDVLITPASGNVQFKQETGNTEGLIELTDDGFLKILSANSGVILGNAATDVYIGDGVNSVDIIFEQSGAVRTTTGKTLTFGQPDSLVRVNAPFEITNSANISNTSPSTSNTSGALIVNGGIGVSGNIYVGGTSAGVNGVYTDVLRYAANGLPWVISSGGGGASPSGYLANTILVANSAGFISNSTSFFTSSNNTIIIRGETSATGNVRVNGDIIIANSATSNTARIDFNASLNTLDFIFN